MVFQILDTQGIKPPFGEHPLFQEALKKNVIRSSLSEEIEAATSKKEHKKIYFSIDGLWCPSCASVIALLLQKEKGIFQVSIDYATDLAMVEYEPTTVGKAAIFEKIKHFGYIPKDFVDIQEKKRESLLNARFMTGAFCSLNIMMFSVPLYVGGDKWEGTYRLFGVASLFLAFPLVFFCALPLWKRCFVYLKAKYFGMEALIFLSVFSSFIFSIKMLFQSEASHLYFDSMGMLIFFVLIGRFLEQKVKFSAKERIFRIMRTLPNKARRCLENGSFRFCLTEEIQRGDLIQILNGEKIPLDGIVKQGEGACDEALLTGEGLPRWKKEGDLALGGSILKQGCLKIEVTAESKDSTLSKIIGLIENEFNQKEKARPLVDKISALFVPLVILGAIFVGIILLLQGKSFEFAWNRSITMCLISCPCVIGLACPLAESLMISLFAKLKVIVRNRRIFRLLGKETLFVFDKTGTVTQGTFKIQKGFEELSIQEKQILKTLAQHSNHPLCIALNKEIQEIPLSLEAIEEVPGLGMRALFDNKRIFLGSASFLESHQVVIEKFPVQEELETTLYFAIGDTLRSALLLSDTLKEEIIPTLQALRPAKTLLLSGDNRHAVQMVASRCFFSDFYSNVNAFEKKEILKRLQKDGEIIAMIGDGINDAPAISASDIGISPSGGSDLSVQSSDLICAGADLSVLPKIRQIGKLGRKIMHQNLSWAFTYNILGIFLAAIGKLTPLFAVFAMGISSLFMLVNTLRLLLPLKK